MRRGVQRQDAHLICSRGQRPGNLIVFSSLASAPLPGAFPGP